MMIMVCPVLFIGWKIIHKTKFHRASEIDLNRDQDVLAEYERNYVPIPPRFAPSTPYL
jgi:amino acid transporter